MQPDPLGLAAGKNPFNYVNQNPLNGTDKNGLKTQFIWLQDKALTGSPHMMTRVSREGQNDVTYSLAVNSNFARIAGGLLNNGRGESGGNQLLRRLAARSLMNLQAIEVLYNPGAEVVGYSNEELYEHYKNTDAIYNVFTIDSSKEEESKMVKELTEGQRGVPYSILSALGGRQCTTSTESALASSFPDYKRAGSYLPKSLYTYLVNGNFGKVRNGKAEVHTLESLTNMRR